jgi:hypothetical protein
MIENGGEGTNQKKPFNFLPFVLMTALAVHAIFEGIATGLQ